MVERIKRIIEKENCTPSSFADRIGISRATMNHLLTGRNNPSLDVISKIHSKYLDINLEWLMDGNGPMYKGEKTLLQPSLFDEVSVVNKPIIPNRTETIPIQEIKKKQEKEVGKEEIMLSKKQDRGINKIIIYYSDNTFENFIPESK